jgi:Bacterial DNA-binding protein
MVTRCSRSREEPRGRLSRKASLLRTLSGLTLANFCTGNRWRFQCHIFARTRATRMGRNPATGESIEIKASKKVAE